MGRAWRGGSLGVVGGGSVARKSAVRSRNLRFFSHILQHPQAIDAHPIPNSLSWQGKTLGLLGLEA